jgi:cation:H+ antiporter
MSTAVAVALYLLLAVVASAVVWLGSSWLETSAERLASHYRLPDVVQGGVIAAIGSSFPELTSTVFATLIHGQFDLGVSVIVGSAIFNILVIPGLAGLWGGPLGANRLVVYKDAQFYILAVAVLLLALSFALIYYPVDDADWTGTMTRPLALLPILIYGLYLFLQQQDSAEYQEERRRHGGGDEGDDPHILRSWGKLVLGLVVVVAGVEGLLRSAINLGELLDTPSFLWGATVVAVGSSLPDLIVSVRAAKRGAGVVSLANVLGSNIFDLLVAVPAGVLVAGAVAVDFSLAAPLMGFLTLATIVLFAMLRTNLELTRLESWVLLGLYVLFVAWMMLETFGVTALVF